eukprot:838905-Prymnesium_polylepis.1
MTIRMCRSSFAARSRTQMIMKKPVMATDGHSYELRAMQKWLLKKQTSPVTGKPLANTTLVINRNLKKLIRDYTYSAATKRKAPIDEDISGSDDDDEPAHRHATAGPSATELIATSPIAAVDETASSSSATVSPMTEPLRLASA